MAKPLTRIVGAWNGYFFAPSPAFDLGVCRAIFFGAIFVLYAGADFAAWAGVAPAFWRPVSLFTLVADPVLPAAWLQLFQVSWKLALLLAAVGLFTRFATLIAAILGLYLLGLGHNFGKVHHFDALVVLVMILLAAGRSGDGFSLDRAVATARGQAAPRPSGEYTWPVRGVWLLMALIFFAAGVAKVRHGGVAWVTSDQLALTLIRQHYGASNADPVGNLGLLVAQQRWLCHLLAGGTVFLELLYPLALFSRRARWLFVPGMLLAQVGIRLTMGPTFWTFIVCNAFWVPWRQVLPVLWLRRGQAAARAPAT